MRTKLLGLALLLAACQSETVGQAKLSLAVKGVGGHVQAAPAFAPRTGLRVMAMQPHQIAGISFTPDRVWVPITRITLNGYTYEVIDGKKVRAGGLSSQDVYRCPGATPADCLVEISSPTALAALSETLRGVSVVEGDYETISVYNGLGDGDAFVKGKLRAEGAFTLQGVTYYTGAAGPMTSAAAKQPTEFEISKGAWDFPIIANGTLSVTPDSAVTVSLFANYDALLYGIQLSSEAGDMSECPSDSSLELAICATEPAIVGYVGETSPSLEYYALAFSGSGWYDGMTGLFVFVLDGEGNVIGIMPKQYFTGAVGAKTGNFFGAVESFTVNADGSVDMTKGTAGNPGYFSVTGFVRADHEGAIELEAQGPGKYTAEQK